MARQQAPFILCIDDHPLLPDDSTVHQPAEAMAFSAAETEDHLAMRGLRLTRGAVKSPAKAPAGGSPPSL